MSAGDKKKKVVDQKRARELFKKEVLSEIKSETMPWVRRSLLLLLLLIALLVLVGPKFLIDIAITDAIKQHMSDASKEIADVPQKPPEKEDVESFRKFTANVRSELKELKKQLDNIESTTSSLKQNQEQDVKSSRRLSSKILKTLDRRIRAIEKKIATTTGVKPDRKQVTDTKKVVEYAKNAEFTVVVSVGWSSTSTDTWSAEIETDLRDLGFRVLPGFPPDIVQSQWNRTRRQAVVLTHPDEHERFVTIAKIVALHTGLQVHRWNGELDNEQSILQFSKDKQKFTISTNWIYIAIMDPTQAETNSQ
jgi:hypothetical protein